MCKAWQPGLFLSKQLFGGLLPKQHGRQTPWADVFNLFSIESIACIQSGLWHGFCNISPVTARCSAGKFFNSKESIQ